MSPGGGWHQTALMLRWLATVVVSDERKGAGSGVRWGSGRRTCVNRWLRVENSLADIRTGAGIRFRDEPGGCSAFWPGGVRHKGDASPICCVCVEQEKASSDTALSRLGRARGSVPNRCEGLSTVAGLAGGPARSSDEALVIRVERRGWVVRDCVRSINRAYCSGGVVGTG